MSSKTDAYVTAAILAAVPEPFSIFDENGRYVQILGGVDRRNYHDGQHLIGKRIHQPWYLRGLRLEILCGVCSRYLTRGYPDYALIA